MELRKAAQQALEALELWGDCLTNPNAQPGWRFSVVGVRAIADLRDALAEDAMQRLTDEQQMIERGTKAWAGVPDATDWIEDLRGNEPVTDCHGLEKARAAAISNLLANLTINGMPAVEGPLSKAHRTCQESRHVEPVAWITPKQDLHLVNYEGFQDWVPLYTAPPKREPLTESFLEELAEKHVTNCYFDTLTYAREIERLHNIGGEE